MKDDELEKVNETWEKLKIVLKKLIVNLYIMKNI